MPSHRDFIPRTKATRIIFRSVLFSAVPLTLTILAMTIGMRITVKEETGRQVDQALEGIACKVDNTLLGVEQTAHIIKGDIPNHLENPEKLLQLCGETIEANPNISGCAIALNPDCYTVGGKPFMAYVYKSGETLVRSETFTPRPFTEQEWYTKPVLEGVPSWVGPLKNENTEREPIISYDVPILDNGRTVGVLGVDVSLAVLTDIAQQYRTTSHSYIAILNDDGSYIVHPDSTRLLYMDSGSFFRDTKDPTVMEILRKMEAGESGKNTFTLNSTPYYVSYMPFVQSALPGRPVGSLGWSIAVIYPQEELISQYDPGFRYTLLIIVVGILLLLAGGIAVSRIGLKPLRKLSYITRRIASGNFMSPVSETSRTDEVGRLQNHFNKMQKSISDHMERLMDLSRNEESRRDELAITYAKTQEAEKYTSDFFSRMTHQMADVTTDIQAEVDRLNENAGTMNEDELKQLLESIERNGLKVTEILADLLRAKN